MTMQEITFLFDALSAISVIASLLYPGYQIYQNTRTMRRTVARDIVRDLNDFGRFFIEMPELVEIHLKGTAHPEMVDAQKRFRFQVLVMNAFIHLELAIGYHKDSMIDDRSNESYARSVAHLVRSPLVSDSGQGEGRIIYSEDLRNRIDRYAAMR
jgi:hypothetical protein